VFICNDKYMIKFVTSMCGRIVNVWFFSDGYSPWI
jgi:hypothetical protein